MGKRKRILGTAMIVLLLCSSLAGCGGADSTTASNNSSAAQAFETSGTEAAATSVEDRYIEVNVGIQVDIGGFSPYGGNNAGRVVCYQTLYDRLFDMYAFGSESVPQLAKSYEYLDDTTIEVKLHENITDSAGNPFTSEDVVFCYDNAKAQGYTECWNYLDHIEIVDDLTVKFYLTDSNITAWNSTFEKGYMYTKEAWEASPDGFANEPVTTSRYKLTNAVPGSSYTLEKRDDWWGNDLNEDEIHPFSLGNADKITYKVIADNAQMAIALETGQIDLANSISSSEIGNFYDLATNTPKEGYYVDKTLNHPTIDLQFNCDADNSVCSDVNVRKAIAYCVDNQAVVDIALNGLGRAAVTFGATELSTGLDWATRIKEAEDPNSMYYPQSNTEKAKELLAEAGYPDGIDVVCMTNTDSTYIKTAEVIQQQCSDAGIHITIQSYDSSLFDTYRATPDSGWDFIVADWGNSQGIISGMYNLVYKSNAYGELGTRNFITAEEDPTLQELLRKSLAVDWTVDDMMAMDEYAHFEQCYFYGLYSKYNFYAAQSGITSIARTGNVCANACTFADDYQCGAPSN